MTMTKKNVFVVFSPGLGGNHVANMLSTADGYLLRATAEQYAAHTDENAHFNENYYNLDFADTSLRIRAMHFSEFIGHTDKIQTIENRQVLLLSLPRQVSLAYRRYQDYHKNLMKAYLYEEQRLIYSQKVIEKLTDETDFIKLNTELVFDESINGFVDFIQNKMNIQLNISECEKMHRTWFNKIKGK